jgi:hypothetical protein
MQSWPITYEPFRTLVRDIADAGLIMMIAPGARGQITELAGVVDSDRVPVLLLNVNYAHHNEALAVMRGRSNFHIGTAQLDTPDSFEVFTREVGAERMVFGSYSPLHYFSPARLCLERAEIGRRDKDTILYKNMARLLG